MKKSSPSKSVRRRLNLGAFVSRPALVLTGVLALATTCFFLARAAVPAEGTVDPAVGSKTEWDGNALGVPAGGPAGELNCVDGVSCDVFTVNVTGNPEDYIGKQLIITITWDLVASDYDLYIRKDSLEGNLVASGENGFAGTSDMAAVNPATSGTGKYIVHVLYGSTVPTDQYHGVASIVQAAEATPGELRTATYTSSGITFSSNTRVNCPVSARDGEPSIRTDYKGNSYVGGIRGVPAGVDLWYFDLKPGSPTYDPKMRIPYYRGQPDGTTEKTEADVGGDGGGDIDLAVGFPPLAGAEPEVPLLAYSSLTLANIPTGLSRDKGETFEFNNAGNLTGGPPGDDRQWHEFLGSNVVYLLYRTVAPAIAQIQRSNDGGFTYGVTTSAGTIGQVGCLDVHQATGTVYASGSSGNVAVGTPTVPGSAPTSYVVRQAATDPAGVSHIFFVAKVADDGTPNGTLYVVYSNQRNILLKSSTDKGETWSTPVRVDPPDGPFANQVNLFPWMETGPTPGSVGIVWYGTKNPENNDNAQWKVYYAQSFNADTATPAFRIAEVTEPEHFIHGSNVSEMGLNPTAGTNRNLIDYFQISFDPLGAAVIAYTDDHNDFDGATFVARQITGPGIKGTVLPAVTEGPNLVIPRGRANIEEEDVFPPQQPGLNGEQVTDFELDVQSGLINRVRTPDALDIESVRYDTSGTGDSLAIAATMRVSDMTVTPPAGSFWRASFAVNAPNSVISPDGTYSFGVVDDADQFYVQANTAESGDTTFAYGTAVRNPDGSISYSDVGAADTGEFNAEDNTVSVQVSVSKLNAVLAAAGRPLITNGSVVAGLRARAVTVDIVAPPPAGRQGRRDLTRGGTQFAVFDSAFARPAPAPAATPLPPRELAPGATPTPTPPTIELANISTRVAVKSGDGAGFGGFIVRKDAPKRLIIRGIGPSLAPFLGNASLADPVLEVRSEDGTVIASNDDWRGPRQAAITATGLAPTNDVEAAVIINVTEAGNYTATLRGKNDAEGIGLIEIYDIGAESEADLGNIATRGSVLTGDQVLIGGFIIRDSTSLNGSQSILVRGIGPSTTVPGKLEDPTLTLHNAQGALITSNDDWQQSPEAAQIEATTIPPTNPKESAILRTLAPGNYTAILSGANGGTGVGLVEIYNLGNQ